jgi:hypothetical protein
MKAGDTVQVAHLDGAVHWIYATVLAANDDGSAVVQIQHPGNMEHASIKAMPKTKIRTKADVQAALDALKRPDAPEGMAAWRESRGSLEAQIDRLS